MAFKWLLIVFFDLAKAYEPSLDIVGFSINDADGSDGRFMIRTGNFTEFFSMQTTAILKLDAGDTVHVDAYQNTGTTLYIYNGGGEAS